MKESGHETRRARIHFFPLGHTMNSFLFFLDYDDANIALGGYTNMEFLLLSGLRKAVRLLACISGAFGGGVFA
jgi:hypothetical protein